MLNEFVVGQQYTNDQISISLRIENLGGIRPSLDANKRLRHLAIMTKLDGEEKNFSENPYHDRIEGDVLTFTGQGKSGDQSLTGRNKRIVEQFETPFPIFCFERSGRQIYIFRGLLELLRYHHESQIDSGKNLRKVLVFEFRLHSEPSTVPIALATDIMASVLPSDRRRSAQQLEQNVVVPEEDILGSREMASLEVEEIRARLLTINPYRFEYLLKDLIEQTGFRDVSVTAPSNDGGIDLNAYVADDNLFFSNTLVQFQAKRWRHSVGSVEINGFRGAISSMAKGVFVTTSFFTKAAIQEAKNSAKPSIALIDGFRLASEIRNAQLDIAKFEDNR